MTPHPYTSSAPRQALFPWRESFLAWPAWLRLLAVSPALLLLWLAVAWALADVS